MQSIARPRHEEECRRFAAYEASSAKEHAVASKLLNPFSDFSDPAYMKLPGDLRAIRIECNDNILTIVAHHTRMLITIQLSDSAC